MRHAILLGIVTLVMALTTLQAWHWDNRRQAQAHNASITPIVERIEQLEHEYLTIARALLASQNERDPLLDEIDRSQAERRSLPTLADRDAAFQTLVGRLRSRFLTAPPRDEASLQEWRRAQDQMNGALHRRRVLYEQLQTTH